MDLRVNVTHCLVLFLADKFKEIVDRSRGGRDRIVGRFTIACTSSAYDHQSCEFDPRSWSGVLDTTLCDKVCQRLSADRWISPSTPVSPTNKTDRHDITDIQLKVALNTMNQSIASFMSVMLHSSERSLYVQLWFLSDVIISFQIYY